jgi:hypothetical protein
MNQNISMMLSVKKQMERIPKNQQDPDYLIIYSQIKNYLRMHCQHNIVDDSVDVDFEQCQSIRYCTYCETVFSPKSTVSKFASIPKPPKK